MPWLTFTNELRHEISNNVVRVPSKDSDQPEHTRSLIRAFSSYEGYNILIKHNEVPYLLCRSLDIFFFSFFDIFSPFYHLRVICVAIFSLHNCLYVLAPHVVICV